MPTDVAPYSGEGFQIDKEGTTTWCSFSSFYLSYMGGLKYHWIRWKDLCAPKEEGGLGFRSLDDVFNVFSIKLWWRFRQNASLWANFMMAKYCSNEHPGMVVRLEGASHT